MAVAVVLAAALGGCSRYQALCDEAIECSDGNDADFDACIIELRKEERIAAAHGCEEEWEDYVACVEENNTCDEDDDGNELQPEEECRDESEDLDDCTD